MTAGIALAAHHLRLDGHLLAWRESLHPFPYCRDLTGHLMSLGYRIFGKWVLSVVDVNIGTTHADLHDLDQNLSLFRLRRGNLPKHDLPWRCHDLL